MERLHKMFCHSVAELASPGESLSSQLKITPPLSLITTKVKLCGFFSLFVATKKRTGSSEATGA